jgi:hypothetical protein
MCEESRRKAEENVNEKIEDISLVTDEQASGSVEHCLHCYVAI